MHSSSPYPHFALLFWKLISYSQRFAAPVAQTMKKVIYNGNILEPRNPITPDGPKLRHIRNQHLTVAAFGWAPHIIFSDKHPTGGLTIEMIKATSKVYNVTYDLKAARNPSTKPVKFNRSEPSGGILSDMISGHADFMFSHLGGDLERFRLLEYKTFGFDIELTFAIGPARVSIDHNSFARPFDPAVWLGLLGFTAVLFIILWSILHLSLNVRPLRTSLFCVCGPLLAQAVKIPHRIRSFVLTWALGSLILSNFYTSNLLSHITLPRPNDVPADFFALAQRHDYELQVMDFPGDMAHKFFNGT